MQIPTSPVHPVLESVRILFEADANERMCRMIRRNVVIVAFNTFVRYPAGIKAICAVLTPQDWCPSFLCPLDVALTNVEGMLFRKEI